MKKIETFMFGNSQIFLDNKNITDDISQKGYGLFSYLLMNNNKSFNREKLANLFWDSSTEEAARYNLRYNIWALRKIFEENKNDPKILICEKDTCKINTKHIYVDAFYLEEMVDNLPNQDNEEYIQKLEKVKDIYKGEFLEGFYIKRCSEFNDWIFFERERLQKKYFNTLSKLAEIYKLKGKFQDSIDNLEAMLKINPLQEELYVRLINVYLELGDRATALYQYERCRKILREELNISPMEETKKAYENIRTHTKVIEKAKETKDKKIDNLHSFFIEYKKDSILENKSKKELNIFLSCYPIGNIGYYYMSSLVKEIIEKYPLEILRELEVYYWKDIYRIENSVINVVGDLSIMESLTFHTEKNRIFSAMLELIMKITKESYLILNIENIEYMDKISFQFFKILLFRLDDLNLKVIINGDKSGEKVSFLQEHFQLEKLK